MKPGLQDSYLDIASKMAADEARNVEIAVFHQPITSLILFFVYFQIIWVMEVSEDDIWQIGNLVSKIFAS